MADVPNTVATLNGLFKVVYAEELKDLVPDFAVLQKKIPFVSADKETGNYYAQPVNLSHEAGFTYNGDAGEVVSLNDAIAGQMKEAQVKGSEIILRSQISYNAMSRASKSGPKAFKRASGWKVEDMNSSMRKRLEIAMLYGQSGIGVVSSVSSDDIVLTAESWAGGIWAGSEGALLEAYTTASAGATQHGRSGGMDIVAVNADTRTITVGTGDVAADTTVATGDILYFKGARTASAFNEMAGLKKIITNSGTLFNIDASDFSLWKGSTSSGTGVISHAKLQSAVAKAVNKGLMEKCLILVSPASFGVLNSDQAALRVFDSSYKSAKGENGVESLVFHSSNGQLEILSHPLVMDGDVFVLPEDALMRLGSSDVTFGVPGLDEQFVQQVPAKNAIEFQCFADQAIFLERPAHAVYMSGVTQS